MPKMKPPLLLIGCLLLLGSQAARADHVYDAGREARLLFVQTASSAAFDGRTLTLAGVAATVYFSDRPRRLYGHVANEAFGRYFRKTVAERFAGDPPNAALALMGEDGATVVLELVGGPEVRGGRVAWRIKALSGRPPQTAGPCSLFIDAFPTPVNGQITD
jgi:hypothetical protein